MDYQRLLYRNYSGQYIMRIPSRTSNRKNSEDSSSAISSAGYFGGPMRSSSLDGQTTDPSGPAPVPVSRFRALDSGKAMLIDDT
jgi:hypothetical protein